ncbi:MAG: oligosaccharide flippase family protein, partial [Caldilineaceae bacterium]|nr:oligosaccharide flippase family protein [Caldilineaceae bacterium]
MAALRTNILANYLGQIWMAAMAVIFLPQYLRILGVEAFGLVGVMLSFQAILQLFDFGIGGAANRELSRCAHDPALAGGSRDLVRTSESVIWVMAAAIALLLWGGSSAIAVHWLHLRNGTPGQAGSAIAIMGLAIALLWPSTFYANCLSGLERQPQLNVIQAVFATFRYAGVLPVLWWVSPTIGAFLWWHALVGVAQSLVMAWLVWRYLPPGQGSARITRHALQRNSRFAGGLFVIGILAMGVSQLDRLVLTSLRPLE